MLRGRGIGGQPSPAPFSFPALPAGEVARYATGVANKPPTTMTTAAVAKALGVSPRRVRQIKDRIGFGRHGSQLAFTPAAVERYKRKQGG